MRFFDSVKEQFNNTEHIESLCRHLNCLGVDARIVDKKGSEAISHKVPIAGNDILRFPRLGVIKVTGHEFEYVEIIRMFMGGARKNQWELKTAYYYIYVLRHPVPKGNDPFTAFFRVNWSGGELARKLGEDIELLSLLKSLGLPVIQVSGIVPDQCIAILKEPQQGLVDNSGITTKLGYGDFPSISHIRAYDLIAKHVKEIGQ